MALIHIPDSFLASKLANLSTNALKCVLIDISTYNRATDAVLANLTEIAATGGYIAGGQAVASVTITADTALHETRVLINTADWASSTISATGAAIIDTTDGNKIIAVDDFQGTVSSVGGNYSIADITLTFTHF